MIECCCAKRTLRKSIVIEFERFQGRDGAESQSVLDDGVELDTIDVTGGGGGQGAQRALGVKDKQARMEGDSPRRGQFRRCPERVGKAQIRERRRSISAGRGSDVSKDWRVLLKT